MINQVSYCNFLLSFLPWPSNYWYFYLVDQKNGVETVTENQAGIKIGEIAVTGGGIMIEGAEIMTGIMTGIVDMIVNLSAPTVMIQEVFADHVLDLGNIQGIMIAIGSYSPLYLTVYFLFHLFFNHDCLSLLTDFIFY